jgi:hypothetical protein
MNQTLKRPTRIRPLQLIATIAGAAARVFAPFGKSLTRTALLETFEFALFDRGRAAGPDETESRH